MKIQQAARRLPRRRKRTIASPVRSSLYIEDDRVSSGNPTSAPKGQIKMTIELPKVPTFKMTAWNRDTLDLQ